MKMPTKHKLLSVMAVILITGLLISMALSGCAKPAPALSSAPAAQAEKFPKTMSVGVGTSGSSSYVFGVAFSQWALQELGIKVIVSETGSSGARAKLVSTGDVELAVDISYLNLSDAWKGTGIFAGQGRQPLRKLITLKVTGICVMSLEKKGIKSFKDLQGKRFMWSNKGMPQYATFVDAMLEYHGMTRNNIITVEFGDNKEVDDGLKAGTVDAAIRSGGKSGTAALQDLAVTLDIRFLSLSDDEINHCIKKEPAFSKIVVPEGVYRGNKEIHIVGVPMEFVVRDSLSDDLVYAICKILMDSCGLDTPGRAIKVHPDSDYTLSSAAPAHGVAPYHPGSVRYFKDRGVWTDEHERFQKQLLAK